MNVSKAWEVLKENGYKKTDKRELILKMFGKSSKYLTARDLLAVLKPRYPGMSFDTIYRNLATFVELGILEETEMNGERKFRMHCESDHHHHHFICLDCGDVKELAVCPMEFIHENLNGYSVQSHKFEIYGKCPTCV
jgi:Fur family transcriptional regulator, zinc uptake regulator